jgi:hypothetical protein
MLDVINAMSMGHKAQMMGLAIFCGAHRIEYRDLGNGEDYVLKKFIEGEEKTLTIKARGNRPDGALLCIEDNM